MNRKPTAQRIPVRSSTGAYTVICSTGLIERAGSEIASLGNFTGIYVLTSPRVAKHWKRKTERALEGLPWRATIMFDDREVAKNMSTVEAISRQLVRAGADRKALLVAVGGGVVGDVAGFVAASFLRGVSLVHIPTTLVGQVDSSIGGKTGVNLPEGKNLVGAFYSPRLVLTDTQALTTLPQREFRSGIYEVVKYGAIGDTALFSYLQKNMGSLTSRAPQTLAYVIPRCIKDKAQVVGRDERESGLREILNFGHTFAHAFETATQYRRYLHGEAVGWGMIAASCLAVRLHLFPSAQAQEVANLIRNVGPLPPMPQLSSRQLVNIMGTDKKTRGGKLRFVLPRKIGKVETVSGIPVPAVVAVLDEMRAEKGIQS